MKEQGSCNTQAEKLWRITFGRAREELTGESEFYALVKARLKRVFWLRLLPIMYAFSPLVCVCFPPMLTGVACRTLDSCFTETSQTFFSPTETPDTTRSQRWRCGARSTDLPFTTWEGTVFMHKFVIENVSPRKTSKTYGQCCKCRTHKHCQQWHT